MQCLNVCVMDESKIIGIELEFKLWECWSKLRSLWLYSYWLALKYDSDMSESQRASKFDGRFSFRSEILGYSWVCVWLCCNWPTLTTALIYAPLESAENKLSFGILDNLYNAILRLQSGSPKEVSAIHVTRAASKQQRIFCVSPYIVSRQSLSWKTESQLSKC